MTGIMRHSKDSGNRITFLLSCNRCMKKVLFLIAAMFLSMPAVAKVCMLEDPTILTTHSQVDAKIAASESNQLAWLDVWKTESGTLQNSGIRYTRTYGSQSEAGTWAVYANQGTTGLQTITGISQCSQSNSSATDVSSTLANNKYCHCSMITPRVGAWVFQSDVTSSANCATNCALDCAFNV